MRRGLLFFSAACALLFALACGGSEASDDRNALAERWLRLGEEPDTSLAVYVASLPPNLVELLNQDALPDTPEEDLVSFPVHPEGVLLGSYTIRTFDGTHVIWLVYDVPLDQREVEATVAQQLDESPWQATSMQANPSISVVEFQSTTTGDIQGSAVMQPQPATGSFDITVERDGSEQTLEYTRSAYIPIIEAGLEEDLTVSRVTPGFGQLAGLEVDDRVVAVGETRVSSRQELSEALQALAVEGERSAGLTYIIQVAPSIPADEQPFVPPEGRDLPERFPSHSAWSDFTVVEFQWLTVAAGRAFQAGMLGTESSTATATRIRDALEADGWEIVDDRPDGFATVLDIAHEDDGYVGTVEIDAFQRDQDYTLVVVEIQTAS